MQVVLDDLRFAFRLLAKNPAVSGAIVEHRAGVDPVGACTGIRGARIKPMIDELNREYLTVVRWEEAAERFIRNALAPLPISEVTLEPQGRKALVTVDSARIAESSKRDRSSLRLASAITGWNIILRGVSES